MIRRTVTAAAMSLVADRPVNLDDGSLTQIPGRVRIVPGRLTLFMNAGRREHFEGMRCARPLTAWR